MSIQATIQMKYPEADLSQYFSLLDTATGTEENHHIAPRAEFQELVATAENIILLSSQEHFYAHYLLALAVPECRSFQTAFCFMAKIHAHCVRVDEMPFLAEIYERAGVARKQWLKILGASAEHSARAFKSAALRNADPVFAAANAERMRMRHANPEFVRKLQILGRKNGPVQGRKNVESGQIAFARHSRWHVRRGIVSAECELCQ